MAHIHVPPVTLEDLHSFQAKHFPHASTPVSSQAQPPGQPQSQSLANPAPITPNPPYEIPTEETEENEEGLGYYPDGTKRTLTDEQIRIFRHSEIQTLLRERQLAREEEEFQAKYGKTNDDDDDGHGDEKDVEVEKKIEADEHSDRKKEELDVKTPAASGTGTKRSADGAGSNEPAAKRHSNSKSKSKMKSKSDTQEDVQLDYNEEESVPRSNPCGRAASQFAGRKIISYDD